MSVVSSSVASRSARIAELKTQPRSDCEASFFYDDHHFQYIAVKVLPGEYFVSAEDLLITTVLGSCVAACIWDSKTKSGGMNHFMLPDGGGDGLGRYGSYAMELLINALMKRGARREDLQAKIFGGAQVVAGFTTMNVGERNTQFVLDYLAAERIPVISQDVRDVYPRRVCFFPISGRALVKRLAGVGPDALAAEERRLREANASSLIRGGSVDLF